MSNTPRSRTVCIPATSLSISVTGSCSITEAQNSTTITYDGILTVNGKHLMHPQDLVARWRVMGESLLRSADQLHDQGAPEAQDVLVRSAAYASAIDVFDKATATGGEYRKIAEVMRALAAETRRLADESRPTADADAARRLTRLTTVLDELVETYCETAELGWS